MERDRNMETEKDRQKCRQEQREKVERRPRRGSEKKKKKKETTEMVYWPDPEVILRWAGAPKCQAMKRLQQHVSNIRERH